MLNEGEYDYNENYNEHEYLDEFLDEVSVYKGLSKIGVYKGGRNENEERHGYGQAILPNGDKYSGYYDNGLRHGHGVYKFANGGKYDGHYKKGKRYGEGTMIYPDGTKYEGFWRNNEMWGQGTYTYKNGDVYSGTWKADIKHGLGAYKFCKTGVIVTSVWQEGQRVKGFKVFYPSQTGGSGYTFCSTWDENQSYMGEGFFVFSDLNCMLRGRFSKVKNPYFVNMGKKAERQIDLWRVDEILPEIKEMLPRIPKDRPFLYQKTDSSLVCDLPSEVRPTMSDAEVYKRSDNLWDEMVGEEGEEGHLGYTWKPDECDLIAADPSMDLNSLKSVPDNVSSTSLVETPFI
ncbi:radial spoke head 1 homolog [Adelges cooleyi]|uniref:radial spoke head 1 homolog n=1 Tax=Adelges cooleyi TaxID=133065 RepID=UPI0021805067|nr:radial spoke head 1 homolog [Adelges cooleyi]